MTSPMTVIRSMLLNRIRIRHPEFDANVLVLARVGKRSRAHTKAARVSQGKEAADLALTTGRLLKLL